MSRLTYDFFGDRVYRSRTTITAANHGNSIVLLVLVCAKVGAAALWAGFTVDVRIDVALQVADDG